MRDVQRLEGRFPHQLHSLPATGSLWAGPQDPNPAHHAALAFQRARRSIQQEGRLDDGSLSLAAPAESSLQAEMENVQQQAIERELSDLMTLRELDPGSVAGAADEQKTRSPAYSVPRSPHWCHLASLWCKHQSMSRDQISIRRLLWVMPIPCSSPRVSWPRPAGSCWSRLISTSRIRRARRRRARPWPRMPPDFTEQELSQQRVQCDQIVQSGNGLHAQVKESDKAMKPSAFGLLPLVMP